MRLILIIFILVTGLKAQFDEPEFFKKINEIYYNLEDSKIDNFSAWITSSAYKKVTAEFYKQENFPLELIWVKPNDIYFIRRPLSAVAESSNNDLAIRAQRDLQLELRNLLENWRRFYAGRLLADMPMTYQITSQGDSVTLLFSGDNESLSTKTCLLFSVNGLLTRFEQTVGNSGALIILLPKYKFTGKFWLCTGWQVSVAGKKFLEVKVTSQKISQMWVPETISIKYDESGKADNTYDFRNVRVNRDIQVLNGNN